MKTQKIGENFEKSYKPNSKNYQLRCKKHKRINKQESNKNLGNKNWGILEI